MKKGPSGPFLLAAPNPAQKKKYQSRTTRKSGTPISQRIKARAIAFSFHNLV